MKQTLNKAEREAGILRAVKAFLDVKREIARTRGGSGKSGLFEPQKRVRNKTCDAGSDILSNPAQKTQPSSNQTRFGLLWPED